MPLHHVLECDTCGRKSDLILLGPPTMGDMHDHGGCSFVCDESWQSGPDGWAIDGVHDPTITCPDCRDKT